MSRVHRQEWTLADIFERCAPEPNSGCWLWTRATSKAGYGQVRIAGRTLYVHRIAAEATGRRIDGLCVCHRCDTPACCNPNHLFVGTKKENTRDMVRKGRARGADRKTHCPARHPYDAHNTYRTPSGTRQCRECNRARVTARRASNRLEEARG